MEIRLLETAQKDVISIRKGSYMTFDKDLGHYVLTNEQVFHEVIMISVPAFVKLERALFRLFGSNAESLMQISGEAAGSDSARGLIRLGHVEEDLRTVFNSVSKWGFGKYELMDLDVVTGYLKFKLHNNPLAARVDTESIDSTDTVKIDGHYFLIGFYKGYFGVLFNSRVLCTETMCMNRGDPFCEFTVMKTGS